MRIENSPPPPNNFSNGPSLDILIDPLSKEGGGGGGGINAVTCFSWATGCPVNIHLRFQLVLKRWRKAGIWFSALDHFLYRHPWGGGHWLAMWSS